MDDARLLDTLTVAFLNDPLYQWLYPDEATRPTALEANLRLTLSLVRERGHVETDPDGTAVALWTAPGVQLLADPAPFLELLERWAPDRVEAALVGMAACAPTRNLPTQSFTSWPYTPHDKDAAWPPSC